MRICGAALLWRAEGTKKPITSGTTRQSVSSRSLIRLSRKKTLNREWTRINAKDLIHFAHWSASELHKGERASRPLNCIVRPNMSKRAGRHEHSMVSTEYCA